TYYVYSLSLHDALPIFFQDPMTSLNPTMRIGKQITEGLIKHQNMSKDEAKKRGIDLLKLVGIPNPERRIKQFPAFSLHLLTCFEDRKSTRLNSSHVSIS